MYLLGFHRYNRCPPLSEPTNANSLRLSKIHLEREANICMGQNSRLHGSRSSSQLFVLHGIIDASTQLDSGWTPLWPSSHCANTVHSEEFAQWGVVRKSSLCTLSISIFWILCRLAVGCWSLGREYSHFSTAKLRLEIYTLGLRSWDTGDNVKCKDRKDSRTCRMAPSTVEYEGENAHISSIEPKKGAEQGTIRETNRYGAEFLMMLTWHLWIC